MLPTRVSRVKTGCVPDSGSGWQEMVRAEGIKTSLRAAELTDGRQHLVAMACDGRYAMPLATTLRSLVEAHSGEVVLHVVILVSEFPDSLRKKVAASLPRSAISLDWRPIELASFQRFSTRPYISKMTYARLLLPELLPVSASRVLYLDADVLVLGDLEELWKADLEGAALGAVQDSDGVAHGTRLWQLTTDARLGSPHRIPPYFNAGVLLIDLTRWREERVSEKAIDYMDRNPDSLLSDQDALNYACLRLWKPFASLWNFQDHDLRTEIEVLAGGRPKIVHFAGRWKPWNPASLSPDAQLYDGFRSRTAFRRRLPERISEAIKTRYLEFRRRVRSCGPFCAVYSHFKDRAQRKSGRPISYYDSKANHSDRAE
jgi:lipopolysaccharide biosynthesis glycosyltransferase